MFSFNISDPLSKKLKILAKKDRILVINFKKKLSEVINSNSIDTYKNLKSPKNAYKRIHLTARFVLLFHVDKINNHIIFVDILHRDKVYK